MTGKLLNEVRHMLDENCLVQGRLVKEGCRVVMADAPSPRLVVDFDRPGSPLATNATRCDYLLVAEGGSGHGWVAVLELKRGSLHADQAVRQLRAGASAAETLVPRDTAHVFRPIAAYGSVSKHERQRLRSRTKSR